MSYHQNPYLGSSEAPPAKRRRGRPRKDQNAVAEKPCPSPSILTRSTTSVDTQRVASASHLLQPVVPTTTTTTTDKGKGSVMMGFSPASGAAVDTNNNNNNDLVGQVVTGRVDGSFDAGLFLSVKVGAGENEKYLRGVVFQPGKFVPVTPQNDIAPLAKMHTRMDFPVPVNHAHEFKTPPLVLPTPPAQTEGGSSQHANSSVAVPAAAASVVDNVADDHQVVASESNNDKVLQPRPPTDVLEKRDLEASIAIQLQQNRAPCQASGSGSSTAMEVESANHHPQPALVQVDTTGSGIGYQVMIAADQPEINNDTNTTTNNNDNSLLSYHQEQQTEPSFAIEMENNDDRKVLSEVLVVNLEPPAAGQVAQTEESTVVVEEQFNSAPTSEKKEEDILVTNKPKEDDGDSTFDKPKQLTDKRKGTTTSSSLALEIAVGDKPALEILVMDSDPNITSPNNDLANPSISQSAQDQEEAPPAEMEVHLQTHLEKEPSLVAPNNEKNTIAENRDDTTTATVFSLIPDAREPTKEKETKEEDTFIPLLPPFPVIGNGIEISSPQMNGSGDVNPEVGSIPNPIVSDSAAITDKGVSEETTQQSACSHTQIEPILPEQNQANSDARKDHLRLTYQGAVSQSGVTSIAVESSIAVEKEEGCGHEQVSNDVVSETKPMDHEE